MTSVVLEMFGKTSTSLAITDTPCSGREHGLSAYMEYGERRYLLDTGASDLFMLNAEKLGVDLGEVDYCLISHGHNDHIGGLSAFLEMKQGKGNFVF